MDKERITELNERLCKERDYVSRKPLLKGVDKGKIDVFNFTLSEYENFIGIFQKYKALDPRGLGGDEPEIRELYDSFRERCGKRTIQVEVKKLEDGEDLQGTYNITFSEEVVPDPLDQIVEEDQPKFLQGWINGANEVANQLRF